MSRRLLGSARAAALVAALPLLMEGIRTLFLRGHLYFWGDQALIDLEARSTLMGHNLLGVYDRYGWHHLGPTWLGLLGLARSLGAGSPTSLLVGSYVLQAAFAAAIVVVADRLGSRRVAWWAAVVVVAYEWSFGLDRLGTVWAPYAVALPTALLVLLIADLASNVDPWPALIGAVACASFLCQTEISTVVVSGVLVLSAPLLRFAAQGLSRYEAPGARNSNNSKDNNAKRNNRKASNSKTGNAKTSNTTASNRKAGNAKSGNKQRWAAPAAWGWSGTGGRRALWGGTAAVSTLLLLWLGPLVQQISGARGNLTAVYRFFTEHSGHQHLTSSFIALGTVLGAFPFRTGAQDGNHDAATTWLVAASPWSRPIYIAYVLVAAVMVALAVAARRRQAFACSLACLAALVAAGLTALTVYGKLYPYLVLWSGAVAIPFWTTMASTAEDLFSRRLVPRLGRQRSRPEKAPVVVPFAKGLPAVATGTALVVGFLFVTYPVPMTGRPSQLGRNSWNSVASAVDAKGVNEVYIDMGSSEAMPDAAAIADQVVRHGRRVEVDPKALYFLDPSFASATTPQLEILVCCGRRYRDLAGMTWRGRAGGQQIYVGRWVTVEARDRPVEGPSAGDGQGGHRRGGRRSV